MTIKLVQKMVFPPFYDMPKASNQIAYYNVVDDKNNNRSNRIIVDAVFYCNHESLLH